MMMYGYGFPWIGGVVMMVIWVFVLGAIVWVVVDVARNGGLSSFTAPRSETPLEVLKRRYANGEITGEQFEDMKHTLDI
jgi:putative membrane protein